MLICLDLKHIGISLVRTINVEPILYVLQMSDKGGGVPLRKIERLFSYMYSTAPSPVVDNARNAPLVSNMATSLFSIINLFLVNSSLHYDLESLSCVFSSGLSSGSGKLFAPALTPYNVSQDI